MTTVYVVTTGEYSDYTIRGVYSTKERADVECYKFADEGRVEEYEFDAEIENKLPPGMWPWHVFMDGEGNSTCNRVSIEPYFEHWYPSWDPGPQNDVRFSVVARDEQHAVKIANEMRAQLIASGEWTTDYWEFRRRREAKRAQPT